MICKIDYSKFMVSNQKEEIISIQKVKHLPLHIRWGILTGILNICNY